MSPVSFGWFIALCIDAFTVATPAIGMSVSGPTSARSTFDPSVTSSEIRFLKGLQSLQGKSVYFADCFEQVGKGEGVTFDGVRNKFAEQYHEHPRRIDYVFSRGPDKSVRGKPLFAKVVFDEPKDGVFASDHFGVLAEISM